jgi:SsrA-binding protein
MSTIIATNKKAFRDYQIFESVEAGIELKGSEVKSFRSRKADFADSFARVENGQVILYNMHISPYAEASYLNVAEKRPRRLLLHKKEIDKLAIRVNQSGFTLIPLKAFFNERGYAKITLALCKGKRLYDKRDDIKKRETELKIKRITRNRG